MGIEFTPSAFEHGFEPEEIMFAMTRGKVLHEAHFVRSRRPGMPDPDLWIGFARSDDAVLLEVLAHVLPDRRSIVVFHATELTAQLRQDFKIDDILKRTEWLWN